jgi:type 1 fimbriae regulatory protein FimB
MILVGFWHGLRASEIVRIKRDDVPDRYLSVSRLKGSLHTDQPLIECMDPLFSEVPAVFEYARSFAGNQRLFSITRQHFWRLFQRYAEEAGIPSHKRHPHVLKHTTGMYFVDKIALNKLQRWIGHKSLSSTGEYLKVSDEDAGAAVRGAVRL